MVSGPRNHLNLLSPFLERGSGLLLACIAELQDTGQITVQVDLELAVDRREYDLVHQRADNLEGLGLGIGSLQRIEVTSVVRSDIAGDRWRR